MKNQILIVMCLLVAGTVEADVLDTWTVRHTDPSYSLTGIGYGKGTYVATGNPGILLTSTDAVTWTQQNLGTSVWLADVAYGNGIFVVVGASGTIFSSSDGISWTPRASGITNGADFNRMRFLNGKFIAVGDGDTIDTSSDGINWTLQNSGLPPVTGNPGDPNNYLSHLYCVNYGNGLYIISGKSSTILLSYDAVNWSPEVINSGCCLGDIVYGNGIFVLSAAFSGPGGIMTSSDGFTWANQSALAGIGFGGMAFAQGVFVGAGGGGGYGKIFSSTDGTTWTQRASNVTANFWNVKYLNGTFIAVGDNGTILQSANFLGPPPNPPTLVQTNRSPTTTELGFQTSSSFKVFTNGMFQSGIALNPSLMTIVLTHGWNDSSDTWPSTMASQFVAAGISANIVAWDWRADAKQTFPQVALLKTPAQGYALGTNLLLALGAGYSQPIHFIGHSFGTEVNAAAADYLQENGIASANIQMTLFDEAEIANIANGFQIISPTTWNLGWIKPLPANFAYADNYVCLVGELQENPNTVNVILTEDQPANYYVSANDLWNALLAYHAVPYQWYGQTIADPTGSVMGDVWSFERNSNFTSPAGGTYFEQQGSGLSLNQISQGAAVASRLLNSLTFERNIGVFFTLKSVDTSVQVAGDVTANAIDTVLNDSTPAYITTPATIGISSYAPATPDYWSPQLILQTQPLSLPAPQIPSQAHPLDNPQSTSTNSPAYAWVPMTIPTNTTSLSFDFMVLGDGASDSFAAAVNGTNIFSLPLNLLQTNVVMNSGPIDVSAYAGTNIELFLGIVGGTSTNASATVSGLRIYSTLPPSLQAQASGGSLALSWPMSAQNFSVQTTTNLADPNSWTTLPNVPAIVNLQNTVTNSISDGMRFYRLKQ